MAHPFQRHREHHIKRERVHELYGHHEGHRDYEHTYHRARGGKVGHGDEAEDRAVVRSMVKGEALKHGHKSHSRADKRARGGKVKHKGKTVVNVNVAPQQSAPHPMPVPMPPPGANAAPVPQPRPPIPAPGGAPGLPPGMPPRARGGRIAGFATGGRVKRADGGDVSEFDRKKGRNLLMEKMGARRDSGLSGIPLVASRVADRAIYRTPLMAQSRSEADAGKRQQMKEAQDISDAVPRRRGGHRATGGPVEPHFKAGVGMGPSGHGAAKGKKVSLPKNAIYAPAKGDMAPTSGTGTGGGVARMELAHRARKVYAKTPPAIHTPGMRND